MLDGAIPSELGQLKNLNWLILSGNGLTGGIPPELGNAAKLSLLDLSGNPLGGEIPPELGRLSDLWKLNLWANRLEGGIPSELGHLVNLERLHLGDNELTGPIPSTFGALERLKVISLRYNQLSGDLPPELENLTDLEEFYLAGNQLTGCFPAGTQHVRTDVILPYCGGSSTDGGDSSGQMEDSCTNGIAVPKPDDNPGLVKDCVTLLAIKNVLAGGAQLDWSTAVPVWQWEGVSIDGTPLRVSGLRLRNKGLRGNTIRDRHAGIPEGTESARQPVDRGNTEGNR